MTRIGPRSRFQEDLERVEHSRVSGGTKNQGINIGLVIALIFLAAVLVMAALPLLK